MKASFTLRRAMPVAARAGTLARGAAGLCLLAGLAGFVAGCGGGGAAAPVRSPAEPAIPGPERKYVVGKGDTLYSIAWRHGIDYRVLAGANSIGDPYTIHPGQRLLVPEPGEAVPAEPGPEPKPAAGADVPSVQGAGTTETPVATPLPPPSPESESPAKASSQSALAAAPAPTAVESPPPAPAPAAVESPPPAPKPAAQPALAARSVAGVRWTRPTGGKTVSTFGHGGNKGIDIEGAFEQPIRAAARGQVVYAGSGLIGYGKLVIVKHSSRLLSAYAHNERLHVGEGDDVKRGQHIADMGRSAKGRVVLHFEIRRDGKPVDPLRFIP